MLEKQIPHEELFENALNEIETAFRTVWTTKKEVLDKVNSLPVLIRFENYIQAVNDYIEKPITKMDVYHDRVIHAIINSEYIGTDMRPLPKRAKTRERKHLLPFPKSQVSSLSCAISELSKSSSHNALRILPYLISAIYINGTLRDNFFSSTPYLTIFRKINLEEECSHPGRHIKKCVSLFDLRPFVNKRIRSNNIYRGKAKLNPTLRSNTPKEILDITDISSYKEYLRKPHVSPNGGKDDLPLTALQQTHLLFAYIYSLAVMACVSDDETASAVDYKTSYELFNSHTLSFFTYYLPYSVTALEDKPDLSANPLYRWVKVEESGELDDILGILSELYEERPPYPPVSMLLPRDDIKDDTIEVVSSILKTAYVLHPKYCSVHFLDEKYLPALRGQKQDSRNKLKS